MIYTVCLPNLYYDKRVDKICFRSNPSFVLPKKYYPFPKQIFRGNDIVQGYAIKFDVLRETSSEGLNVKISISINPENDISIISKMIEAHISNIFFTPLEIKNMNEESFYENHDSYPFEDEGVEENEEEVDYESDYSDLHTF